MRCPKFISTWFHQLLLRDLPEHWRLSYFLFCWANFLTIGTHWMINPVKQAVFNDVVGKKDMALAKSLVPVVQIPIMLLYNIVVSCMTSARFVVLTVCIAYASLFILIAITLGSGNKQQDISIAWLLFFVTETRGAIVNVVVWTVINDVSDPSYVKHAYPVLSFVTQLGAISGSLCAVNTRGLGGVAGLLIIQAVSLVGVLIMVWFACTSADQAHSNHTTRASLDCEMQTMATDAPNGGEGTPKLHGGPQRCQAVRKQMFEIVEGIWLISSRPYVAMTFWVSCAHHTIRTIIEIQGNALLNDEFEGDRAAHVEFQGKVMLVCSVLTALLTALGTRSIVERCGLTLSLLALPLSMFFGMALICFFYGFWIVMVVSIVTNTICYGLNSPCREILYVRTSRAIKYRAKGWTDMYGSFLQKTLGAQFSHHVNIPLQSCQPHCFHSGISFSFSAFWTVLWIVAAFSVGRMNARLEQSDEKIE